MKKIIVLLFFINAAVFSQEKNNLQFKSISVGFGFIVGQLNDGGLNINIDATTALKRNLLTFSFMTGGEIQIVSGDSSRNFMEYDLLYGREFKINKFLKIETHTGIGIYNEKYKNGLTNFVKVSETSFGIPIKVKLLFYPTNHFALGINPNVNINSIDTIYSVNIIFQYNFKTK